MEEVYNKLDGRKRAHYPQCDFCTHRTKDRSCKAFDYIPDMFWMDDEKHDKIVVGQNKKFVFEIKKEKE